jgi:hypothetical protein
MRPLDKDRLPPEVPEPPEQVLDRAPAEPEPFERPVHVSEPEPEPEDQQPATIEALAERFGQRRDRPPTNRPASGRPGSDRSRQEREKQAAILARLRGESQ